ncbi:perlucin-like protein [Saccostrea echinata]|uniref:perlucin-like protein n=1 Tax=Saccostrea echinata TaxID=191078 RepID=UPI002A83150B|nr:perlucin-like protein [Saccostrea echinata]
MDLDLIVLKEGDFIYPGIANLNRINRSSKATKQSVHLSTNCSNKGAYLVEIDSKEEDDWIVEQISMRNAGEDENQFLGANSEAELGVWRWSSNNALISYSNFWPGQPNLYAAERCVILDWIAIHGTYKWADTRCLMARKFICEKDM